MNLSEDQNRYLALLTPGRSAVFYEGLDDPFLVAVPHYPEVAGTDAGVANVPDDREIERFMADRVSELSLSYGKHVGCALCRNKCKYSDLAERIIDDPAAGERFSNFVLAMVESTDLVAGQYQVLKEALLERALYDMTLSAEEIENLMLCFLIKAGRRLLSLRRRQYRMSTPTFIALRDSYLDILKSYFAVRIKSQLSADTERAVERFRGLYTDALHVEVGPFPGCREFCKHQCLFRFEVRPFLAKPWIEIGFKAAVEFSKGEIREFCFNVARMVSVGQAPVFLENIALCFFIQKCMEMGSEDVARSVRKWFMP
jgi:hypothetical protein